MIVSNLSESTKLMNCIIALSKKSPDFPYPLFTKGFQVEAIEPTILLESGQAVRPDVQLKRNTTNNLLMFECKDGFCEGDQLTRYQNLSVADIIRGHCTDLPSSSLSLNLVYFGTKAKEEKLLGSITHNGNRFPILILDTQKIYLGGNNRFGVAELDEIFTEITFDKPVPESYIPFTINDSNKLILRHVLRELVTYAGSEVALDDMLKKLFPDYGLFSRDAITALKGRIGNLLQKINAENPTWAEYVSKREGGKYRVSDRGLKGFKTLCTKIIEKEDSGQQHVLRDN